jgi:hypothetical protein
VDRQLLGVTLLVRRFRSTLPAALPALVIPLAFAIMQGRRIARAVGPRFGMNLT